MRRRGWAAVLMLVCAIGWFAAPRAEAQSISGTLSLSPTHGKAGDSFSGTVTFTNPFTGGGNGCVGGLSPRDAAAIALVTRFGFSPTDVALAFDITPGAAKVLVHRARRRLRDALTLELNVRARSDACALLAAFRAAGDLVGAGRHVRDCDDCLGAAVDQLSLYDASGAAGHRPSIRT